MNELEPDILDDAVTLDHEAGIDDATAAWARSRGFKVGLPNVLVVIKVRDLSATLEVFKAAYPPRYLRQNIEPYLTRLPLRLDLAWPEIGLLLDALRTSDAFDYEVKP